MTSVDQYALPATVSLLGIYQLTVRFVSAVVKSRQKFQVQVPDTVGPPEFIRTHRAHQNTLEYFTTSLVCLWIAAVFFHPVPASLAYLGYLVGREQYFWGYIQEANNRIPGFYVGIKFLTALFAMCIVGVLHKLLRYYFYFDFWQKCLFFAGVSNDEL
ncbi:leukotriene C4 synthase-like [Physella acuta]|uniref:leukotriene C4 synthase-like n=1 Tax=Physella acuta TaxID=109671 RepID=UPI0027DB39BC|nr:leukotriene C4 synthase-like [Physella acuta]